MPRRRGWQDTIKEPVGKHVGFRVRFGSENFARAPALKLSPKAFSQIWFWTILSLEGVAAVLFDEFHERSLDADLGLALARDAQQGLREDLKLLVMSATIDGARVSKTSR